MAHPQVEQQARRNAAIVALAAQQLDGVWPSIDWDAPQAVEAVKRFYRAVVSRYGQASAAVAAEFYDTFRAEREFAQRFRAAPAEVLPQALLDRTVEMAFVGTGRSGVDPNSGTTADLPVEQRVPLRLADKLQRHVRQPGRDTIAINTDADPVKPLYVRVPRGATTCAFCVILASREISKRFRGYVSDSVKYHNHCDCEAVPVFPGQSTADVSPKFGDYEDMYSKAVADAGTRRDLKKILASMRHLYGVA
jgi:hypothetical protein